MVKGNKGCGNKEAVGEMGVSAFLGTDSGLSKELRQQRGPGTAKSTEKSVGVKSSPAYR